MFDLRIAFDPVIEWFQKLLTFKFYFYGIPISLYSAIGFFFVVGIIIYVFREI